MYIRTLIALAVILGLGNPAAAIISSVEHVKGSEPVLLALFVLPWLVGAELLRRGKVTAGAILVGLLSLLDVVSFAGWTRTSTLDWVTQSFAAAASAVALVLCVTVVARQHRGTLAAGAVR